jgi:hypothetical protein
MITLTPDIENLKKCTVLYALNKKIGYSSYAYPSKNDIEIGKKYNSYLELINDLEKSINNKDIEKFLSLNVEHSQNNKYIVCGWSLWDQRVCFNFKGNDGKSFLYNLEIVSTGYDSTTGGPEYPYFRLKQRSLEEMYDVVRESNFIERDYSDEIDVSFYFEELKPSASSDTIIDIEEDAFKEHARYTTDINRPFKEIIENVFGTNSGNFHFASKITIIGASLMKPISVEVGDAHYTISDSVIKTK